MTPECCALDSAGHWVGARRHAICLSPYLGELVSRPLFRCGVSELNQEGSFLIPSHHPSLWAWTGCEVPAAAHNEVGVVDGRWFPGRHWGQTVGLNPRRWNLGYVSQVCALVVWSVIWVCESEL